MPDDDRRIDIPTPESVASPPNAWETLEILSEYEIRDTANVEHVHTHRVKAKANLAQRFYERRFNWTGSGKSYDPPVVRSETDGVKHKLHGPTYVEDDWTFYLIDLGRRQPVNKVVEVVTDQRFFDENRTFKPYFRLRARNGLLRLELKVSLPPNLFKNVRPTLHDSVRGHPYDPSHLQFDVDSTTATLLVVDPEIDREYGISWL